MKAFVGIWSVWISLRGEYCLDQQPYLTSTGTREEVRPPVYC